MWFIGRAWGINKGKNIIQKTLIPFTPKEVKFVSFFFFYLNLNSLNKIRIR